MINREADKAVRQASPSYYYLGTVPRYGPQDGSVRVEMMISSSIIS